MSKEVKITADTKYTISIGCKIPSRIPYAMADANITVAYDESDDFSASLDDAVEKLDEAISASLLVIESKHKQKQQDI